MSRPSRHRRLCVVALVAAGLVSCSADQPAAAPQPSQSTTTSQPTPSTEPPQSGSTPQPSPPAAPPSQSAAVPKAASAHRATPAQVRATRDRFGIRYLYPTQRGGTYWSARWQQNRTFDRTDPRDRWFDADYGSASYRAGNGVLRITGDYPRMYVYQPARKRQWGDVEITAYFKRVRDRGVPYAGMVAVARSHHLQTRNACDTRGYGARMRYDGTTDFEKETSHPANEATSSKRLWKRGMPYRKWIGYKFVVFDKKAGVKLELWADLKNNGRWRKVNQFLDTGRSFGDVRCKRGIDPTAPLRNSRDRRGSESGKPNLTVYFRSDGVKRGGLRYRQASIREINPR